MSNGALLCFIWSGLCCMHVIGGGPHQAHFLHTQVDRLAAHNRELEQQYGAADAELQRTAAAAEGTAQQQQAALAGG